MMQKKIILAILLTIILIVAAVSIYTLSPLATSTPDKPSELTATKLSSTRIDLTWVKAKNADTTIIERNNLSSWSRGSGLEIYNDTGNHTQDIIPPTSSFYYQAWSWNQTKNTYSSSSASTNITQPSNQPPVFGAHNPVNGTRNVLLSFSWSILITDPEGDPFTWSIQCSNKLSTSGANARDGTKTLILYGLANLTTYTVWVNATDPAGSGKFTRAWYTFTTTSSNQSTPNRLPIFGTPSPANNSINNNLSLTWSIPINDPEGKTYTYSIQCSNKQVISGTGLTNGSRNLILTNLAGNTTYKVWVNASDPFNPGLATRAWYIFKTKVSTTTNTPPAFGTPTPENESTNNPLNLAWSILIRDAQGNTFSWTIQCNNGQASSASGATNGTKTLTLTGLATNTTYKVWVNATDAAGSGQFTKKWYIFKTQTSSAPNYPPRFGAPTPGNASTNNTINLSWSIPINDPEGNPFTWTIHCSNGQTNSGSGATNGSKTISLTGLAYSTSYKVWVNATDPAYSGIYNRSWYTFSTKANLPPTFGASTPANRSVNQPLSLTWSISINDPDGNLITWSISCSNGKSNSSTNSTNGTKTLTLTNLSYSTTYTLWVNATDPAGSGLVTRRWYTFTTKINQPPGLGAPSPVNTTANNPLTLTWSIPIEDPDSDLFTWSISCSNGQTNSSTNSTNGTKSLSLTGLTYSTTYKIWVNATDPAGSGLYTRRWYQFTTLTNQAPNPPTITGPANAKVRVTTEYTFITLEPENENITLFVDWDDGTNTTWLGPYLSGVNVTLQHTWSRRGTYEIKAKAKDIHGQESDWGTLSIKMPFSFDIPFQTLLQKLFTWFPHAFPLLRYLFFSSI